MVVEGLGPTRTSAAAQARAAAVPVMEQVVLAVRVVEQAVPAVLVEPAVEPAWPWDPAARRRRTRTAVEVVRSFRHRRAGDPPTPAPMPTVDREKPVTLPGYCGK
jgi:hypothetical protein